MAKNNRKPAPQPEDEYGQQKPWVKAGVFLLIAAVVGGLVLSMGQMPTPTTGPIPVENGVEQPIELQP